MEKPNPLLDSIDIEKLYELLDVTTPVNLDLFKYLFITLATELGDQRHHLVGLAFRIQGEFDCFFHEWQETGVLGDPGWAPLGDFIDSYYCFGRAGRPYVVGSDTSYTATGKVKSAYLLFHFAGDENLSERYPYNYV
jgi:hypothetical protein